MKFPGAYDYTVILTYASLVSAVCGMMLSAAGQFTAAVLCLLASGLCDAFDGVVARSKSNRTEEEKAFGIQLDSLCDTVSFGVFPVVLQVVLALLAFFFILDFPVPKPDVKRLLPHRRTVPDKY